MNIVPIDETTKYVNENKAKEAETMNQEDFLHVLVTQMQNQNPMDPMDDFEYMTQITQFSMLESINGLSMKIDNMKALDYIGKNVIASIMNEDNPTMDYIEGLVESITLQDDEVLLNTQFGSVYMDNVVYVY